MLQRRNRGPDTEFSNYYKSYGKRWCIFCTKFANYKSFRRCCEDTILDPTSTNLPGDVVEFCYACKRETQDAGHFLQTLMTPTFCQL